MVANWKIHDSRDSWPAGFGWPPRDDGYNDTSSRAGPGLLGRCGRCVGRGTARRSCVCVSPWGSREGGRQFPIRGPRGSRLDPSCRCSRAPGRPVKSPSTAAWLTAGRRVGLDRHVTGLFTALFIAVAYYTIFRLPFHFPPTRMITSTSLVFGFNNSVALACVVLLIAAGCLVLRPTPMFGWFDRKRLGWLSTFMRMTPVCPVPGHGRYVRQPAMRGTAFDGR
jgi:hypothetical protein